MALQAALLTVLNRNGFYRDAYRFLLRLSIVQALFVLLLAAVVVVMLVMIQPEISYFATATDGRVVQMQPRGIIVE